MRLLKSLVINVLLLQLMLKGVMIMDFDVYLNGGRVNTGKDAVEWAVEVEKRGAGEILLTSMDYKTKGRI